MTGKDCLGYFLGYCVLNCTRPDLYDNFINHSEWVHLPYKVGDTVWFITGIHNTLIKDAKVERLSIDETGVSYIRFRTDNNIYFEKDINEFYLTRKEAEKALEDINNG